MLDLGATLIACVERDPHRIAMVDGERRFSYEQWLNVVNGLRHGLESLGLRHGEHVVTCLQNRWQAAAVHWACQLAGMVVTPINWRAKCEELDYVLTDARAPVLVYETVSGDAVAQSEAASRIKRIAITANSEATHEFDALIIADCAPPQASAAATDTSVMLYTSGTTGRGKGVPRSHFAERQAALAHVAQNCYRIGERTLGVMPLYHTMGVRSLLAMTLLNGRFVCQPRFDACQALDLIEREAITSLYLVPTLYHDLLQCDAFAASDVASVRKLGFAGAPMTDGLLRRLDHAFKPQLFVNHYGSSEIYTFTVNQDAPAKPGCAGKAGLNQRIRVVRIGAQDPAQLMAACEEGEIIASLDGDESFTGYWQRPDADQRSLIDGWYFTGDIGFFDHDGDLFVTGRVDDMMVSGGENIMPVEIENVLSLHPQVSEVAVVGLPHERLGQQVTAFVTRSGRLDAAMLDALCKQSDLADFKRPRQYVFVKSIPKSPVGKILRRLLVAGDYETD